MGGDGGDCAGRCGASASLNGGDGGSTHGCGYEGVGSRKRVGNENLHFPDGERRVSAS